MGVLIRQAVGSTILLAVILCGVYPLIVTGVGKVAFPHQASGSLIVREGNVIGSELIAQRFTGPEYFHPRPSAAGENGYDAKASGGSNLGPTSAPLAERIRETAAVLRAERAEGVLPPDLLTASGSGLDPHLSPEGTLFQVKRVAAARGLPEAEVEALVKAYTEKPDLGFMGEPRVNVLKLNLALDSLAKQERSAR